MDTKNSIEKHPCYDKDASKQFGRMHLPVAPKCNISCNYCNRKFDCSNECRPGVTSKVLTVDEAFEIFEEGIKLRPYITTVGIAGPGDSLANPDQTFGVLEKIHAKYPHINLCVSTNGLMLEEYVNDLLAVNAKFITVTVNAINPETAAKVYHSVRYNGRTYRGVEAGEVLLERQRAGIARLTHRDAVVKLNTVYIPEVNPNEIIPIADMGRDLGAFLMNVTPLIPVAGSRMADFRSPSELEIDSTKAVVSSIMEIMDHCNQCRSDACGLLTEKDTSIHKIKPEAREREARKKLYSHMNLDSHSPAMACNS